MNIFIQWFLGQISPKLRAIVIKCISELDLAAKTTPNKWDDILVGLLKDILDIKE